MKTQRTDGQLTKLAQDSMKRMLDVAVSENIPFHPEKAIQDPKAAVEADRAALQRIDDFDSGKLPSRKLPLGEYVDAFGEGWDGGTIYEGADKSVYACASFQTTGDYECFSIPTGD